MCVCVCVCVYIYIYINIYICIYIVYIYTLKPLKSEAIHETGLSGNVVTSLFSSHNIYIYIYVYTLSVKGYCDCMICGINKIIHRRAYIRYLSSRVQLDISLVSYRVELSQRNSAFSPRPCIIHYLCIKIH